MEHNRQVLELNGGTARYGIRIGNIRHTVHK